MQPLISQHGLSCFTTLVKRVSVQFSINPASRHPFSKAWVHDSSIFRQSSNPLCGFSMMGQVRLCAIWPTENWLGSSFHGSNTGLEDSLRVLQACFRKRMSASQPSLYNRKGSRAVKLNMLALWEENVPATATVAVRKAAVICGSIQHPSFLRFYGRRRTLSLAMQR